MSTFPFFSIPVLAQNEILKNMKLRDIFLLSTCSKRSHRSVKTASIYLPHLKIYITDSYKFSSIRLEPATTREDIHFCAYYAFWMKTSHTSLPRFEMDNVEAIFHNGVWEIDSITGNRENAFEALTRHILDLFTNRKLDVTLIGGNIRKRSLWKVTKTLDVLRIDSKMSVSETEFVKEELKVAVLIDPTTCWRTRLQHRFS